MNLSSTAGRQISGELENRSVCRNQRITIVSARQPQPRPERATENDNVWWKDAGTYFVSVPKASGADVVPHSFRYPG